MSDAIITNIGGVFLTSEEATRLYFAIEAFGETMALIEDLSMSDELPLSTLKVINQELRFARQAGGGDVFEFQSDDNDRVKHLIKQKTRLEAALKDLKRVPSLR